MGKKADRLFKELEKIAKDIDARSYSTSYEATTISNMKELYNENVTKAEAAQDPNSQIYQQEMDDALSDLKNALKRETQTTKSASNLIGQAGDVLRNIKEDISKAIKTKETTEDKEFFDELRKAADGRRGLQATINSLAKDYGSIKELSRNQHGKLGTGEAVKKAEDVLNKLGSSYFFEVDFDTAHANLSNILKDVRQNITRGYTTPSSMIPAERTNQATSKHRSEEPSVFAQDYKPFTQNKRSEAQTPQRKSNDTQRQQSAKNAEPPNSMQSKQSTPNTESPKPMQSKQNTPNAEPPKPMQSKQSTPNTESPKPMQNKQSTPNTEPNARNDDQRHAPNNPDKTKKTRTATEILESLDRNVEKFSERFGPNNSIADLAENLKNHYNNDTGGYPRRDMLGVLSQLDELLYILNHDDQHTEDARQSVMDVYDELENHILSSLEVHAGSLVKVDHEDKTKLGWFLASAKALADLAITIPYNVTKPLMQGSRFALEGVAGVAGGLVASLVAVISMPYAAAAQLYNNHNKSSIPVNPLLDKTTQLLNSVVHSYLSNIRRPVENQLNKWENQVQAFQDKSALSLRAMSFAGSTPEASEKIQKKVEAAFDFREKMRQFKTETRNARDQLNFGNIEKENTSSEVNDNTRSGPQQ